MKVVGRAAPFHRTADVATKPLPLTVRVKSTPPAVTLLGASEPSVGAGLLIVKARAAEVPPPGAGVSTVTWAVPAVAISPAAMAAWSWVLLTKVVVRAVPFHCTRDDATKLLPLTVSVKPTPPAWALPGA